MRDIGTSSQAYHSAAPTQQQQLAQQQQQQQQQQHLRQQWRVDRLVGIISISMWVGTAFRVMPALTLWENAQSVAAIVTSEWMQQKRPVSGYGYVCVCLFYHFSCLLGSMYGGHESKELLCRVWCVNFDVC